MFYEVQELIDSNNVTLAYIVAAELIGAPQNIIDDLEHLEYLQDKSGYLTAEIATKREDVRKDLQKFAAFKLGGKNSDLYKEFRRLV